MARDTLAEYLEEFRSCQDVAFLDRRGYRTVRWTYHQIAEFAARIARELERLGIQKGDRVVLWGDDCGEWVAAFYGCMLRGAVAVPVDKISTPDVAARITQQVQARVVFGSRSTLDQFSSVTNVAKILFEELPSKVETHSSGPYQSPLLGRTDPLEILFTSGATAEPKGVVLTHGNVLANLAPLEQGIAKYLRYERLFHPIRFLNLVPLSHVFGQFMGIFVPQLLHGTVLFADSLNPSEVIGSIKRERVSVLVAVPRMLDSLKTRIEAEYEARGELQKLHADIKAAEGSQFLKRWLRFRKIHARFGWKFWAVVSGGAALESATEEFWNRLGFAAVQGYGMTETTSLVSLNHPFGVQRGSIGKVLPGREMKLDDSGEILVRGESVAAAYWQGGEMKSVTANDGWLRTGDLGAMDSNGNLFFKGRKKNVIVTPEGMNVYPQDLEAALRSQAGVKDCVVLPLPRGGNSVPGAVLLMDQPSSLAAEEIIERANESLAEYQRIRDWFVWAQQDFPRTSTQKPRIAAILEVALAKMGSSSRDANPAAGSGGSVADLVTRVTGRPADALSGLSSLERVDLVSAIEDRFQVELNESKFTSALTIADLEQMVRKPSVERTDFSYPRWVQRWPVTWIRRCVYYLLTWPATYLLSMPRIQGRERLRDLDGPVLVICNHVTYLDAGFVLAALPHRLRNLAIAMEGERVQKMRKPPEDWSWVTRLAFRVGYWLMTPLFHAFPLPQRGGFRESFRFAGDAAGRGYSVLVFPEGMRTPDGKLHPFRAGIGLLASGLNLPVVPMRIQGLWEIKKSGRRGVAPWGKIRVSIGDPIRFPRETDPAEITKALEQAVESL